MNRAELIDAIWKVTGQTKAQISDTVSALLHCLTGTIAKGERATLVGFGTFERRFRRARVGVNPQNPAQRLRIEAAKVPAFRAGQELKDVIDGKIRQPALPKWVAAQKAPQKSGGKKRR